MRRPLLLTLAAGAALTVAGCGGSKKATEEPATTTADGSGTEKAGGEGNIAQTKPDGADMPTANPPPPPPPPPIGNPPMPTGRERIALIQPGLPKFADVPSPHPPGATNPPSPVLLVTPDGRCFVTWEGGMIPPGPDRVVKSVKDMTQTTAINCPVERAQAVWDKWDAGGRTFGDKPEAP